MMTSGKVITSCGDCIHYNFKKHKCNVGHSAEIDAKERFYADCTTFENVEEYERKAYNKAVDDCIEELKKRRDTRYMKVNCDDVELKMLSKKLKGAKQNEDFK